MYDKWAFGLPALRARHAIINMAISYLTRYLLNILTGVMCYVQLPNLLSDLSLEFISTRHAWQLFVMILQFLAHALGIIYVYRREGFVQAARELSCWSYDVL